MAWTRSDLISIDHTKVPNTDQTDFPVRFAGTYAQLATTGNGGVVTSSNGYDIIFASDSAGASPLKFERTNYNATTGKCEFWVKVPTVSCSIDTVIYVLSGNSAVTTDQQDAANTWNSAIQAVWHFEDGSTLSLTDSTTNANNGTNHGATATTGQMGLGAANFDGATQYIDMGASATLHNSVFTYTAWINPTTVAGGTVGTILGSSADHVGSGGIQFRTDANKISILQQNTANIGTSTGTFSASVWTYVAVTYNSSGNFAFYINGAPAGSGTNLKTFTFDNEYVGAAHAGPIKEFFPGALDEIRMYNTAQSADWIKADYNSQSSPSTFYWTPLAPAGADPINISKLLGATALGRPDSVYISKLIGAVALYTPSTNPPSWPIFSFGDGYVNIVYFQAWDMPTAAFPVTYTVNSGSLPPGLSVSGITGNQGKVSGTPTTVGTYSFVLRASNAYGTADRSFSITIHANPGGGASMFLG